MNTSTQLSRCLQAGVPPLLVGPPGCGKTARLAQAAADTGRALTTLYAWQLDPVEIGGLPLPVGEVGARRIERVQDDLLAAVFAAPAPLLLLIDELGQASPSQQAALAPLLLARRIGRWTLPDHVAVAAATNRRTDRAGAGQILSHLVSRCALISVEPDLDEFLSWGARAGVHPDILGLLRWRSPLLSDFSPDRADQPCANPRSWESMSRLLHLGLSAAEIGPLAATVVGDAAAAELAAFCVVSAALPDLDALLAAPDRITLPAAASARYALAAGLAYRTCADTAQNVCRAAERLQQLGAGEYAALLLRDAMLRAPEALLAASAWPTLVAGPLGEAIRTC